VLGCYQDCTELKAYKGTALFWAIMQQVVVIPYRRFGTTHRSHLQRSRIQEWPRRAQFSPTLWRKLEIRTYEAGRWCLHCKMPHSSCNHCLIHSSLLWYVNLSLFNIICFYLIEMGEKSMSLNAPQ
jgi:hypothetical protein